jgi:hypothetical protein
MNTPFGMLGMAAEREPSGDNDKAYKGVVMGFDQENHGTVLFAPLDGTRTAFTTTVQPKEVVITKHEIDIINNIEKPTISPLLENMDGESFDFK